MQMDEFDDQIDGQMSFEDLFQPPERLIAVSRIFARARKEMSLAEQKAFAYALTQINFKDEARSNIVYVDKKTLARKVDINSDPDHLSANLKRAIGELPIHSFIEISDRDRDLYDSGVVVSRITMLKNRVRIKFEEDYMSLFTGLSTNYVTMWSGDIFGMQSKRSVQFYELLRQLTDTRLDVNQHGWGVRQLKEMFNIPKEGKGSYMRKDGHFDRPAFEKYVIQPLCDDLQKCRMINLVVQPDGKLYEKVKQGNRVSGYRFYWTFTSHPAVATAEEVYQIQQRADKNPQVLKIAKDLLEGERRSYQQEAGKKSTGKRSQTKKNQFTEMETNQYDFDALEEDLLARSDYVNQVNQQMSIEDYPEYMPD